VPSDGYVNAKRSYNDKNLLL